MYLEKSLRKPFKKYILDGRDDAFRIDRWQLGVAFVTGWNSPANFIRLIDRTAVANSVLIRPSPYTAMG